MYFKRQIFPLIGSNNGKGNKKIYYYQIFFNIFYFRPFPPYTKSNSSMIATKVSGKYFQRIFSTIALGISL